MEKIEEDRWRLPLFPLLDVLHLSSVVILDELFSCSDLLHGEGGAKRLLRR